MNWSVVITTRNRAAMLRRAIESCIKQTMACEVVVVDEASTDDTPNVVSQYPGVVYIRNAQPLGHSGAANKGISAAQGDWIKPVDDDDWLAPNCISALDGAVSIALARGKNPVIASGRSVNVDEHEAILGETRQLDPGLVCLPSRQLLEMMMIEQAPIGTPVQVGHSRAAAIACGGWNADRTIKSLYGDEVELWIKLARLGDAVFLPDIISYRTIWDQGHAASATPSMRFGWNMQLKQMIAQSLNTSVQPAVQSFLALHWGLVALKDKKVSESIPLLGKALTQPSSFKLFIDQRKMRQVMPLLEHL